MFTKIKKLVERVKQHIASKKQQEILVNEINEDIILTKFDAIKNQLMNTDKAMLVGLILGLKIEDDSDIHYYYERLQEHKQMFLNANN